MACSQSQAAATVEMFFPFVGSGHQIPMVDIARVFDAHGANSTILRSILPEIHRRRPEIWPTHLRPRPPASGKLRTANSRHVRSSLHRHFDAPGAPGAASPRFQARLRRRRHVPSLVGRGD